MNGDLLQLPEVQFLREWETMPPEDKAALPLDYHHDCIERYRRATPYVDASIARAHRGASKAKPPEPDEWSQPKFTATSLDRVLLETPRLEWVVQGLIEVATLNVMFGDEGTRKSFLALDLGLCVSSAIEWHGRKVKPGRVLYLAGEGKTGLARRAKGWLIRRGIDPTPDLFFGDRFVPLVSPLEAEHVIEWLRDMNTADPFVLVIVDTVARALAGASENSADDMGSLIENLDRMRQITGAAQLGVHHQPLEVRSGKGRPRPRGHSSLPAAADGLIAVEFDEQSGIATVTPVKLKDSPTGEQLRFEFDVVDIGTVDSFGSPITTLVPRRTDERPAPKPDARRGPGKNQRAVIEFLERRGTMTRPDLVKTLGEERDIGKSAAHHAITGLIGAGVIRNLNGILSL